ncbi:fibronectin type 3 and ankyrin repeat domains protein 1-like [Oscarella lobularis]|uniref:fibronectin type 3 and ankyrin repeat domains protein 1-like n=1 Tax=Oscarella lobularis TaxID=121494 RepID=UPI003313D76F
MSEFAYLEFFSAITKGDEEVVSRFIRNHPEKWKEAANELGSSSLHFALDAKTAEFLISAGASLEAEWGFTPFLRAVLNAASAVLAVLAEHDCNISAKDKMGDGALAIASSTCQLEMVKQLVRLGLCINERHENGYTSLHWASQKGSAERVSDFSWSWFGGCR